MFNPEASLTYSSICLKYLREHAEWRTEWMQKSDKRLILHIWRNPNTHLKYDRQMHNFE